MTKLTEKELKLYLLGTYQARLECFNTQMVYWSKSNTQNGKEQYRNACEEYSKAEVRLQKLKEPNFWKLRDWEGELFFEEFKGLFL